MKIFQSFGLVFGLLHSAFCSPLVERQGDFDVVELLDYLSSYETASGDCGIALGVKFSTETRTIVNTKTVTDSATLVFKTVTEVPSSAETETITAVHEWYEDAYTVVPGTYTQTNTVFVTYTAIIVQVDRVTKLIPDPDNITTVTKTTGYRELLITAFKTVINEVDTTTTYTKPTPAPLLGFDSNAFTTACSVFLKAPIPQPFIIITEVTDVTTTSYLTTRTGTRTVFEDMVYVTTTVEETFTMFNPRPNITVVVTKTGTRTVPVTSTTVLSLTQKTRQTSTTTVSAPIAIHTTTSTVTVQGTKTVSVPLVCKSPIPGSTPMYYRNGKGQRLKIDAQPSRVSCCTLCANTPGCAGYEYFVLGDCYLVLVEQVDDAGDVGRMSSHCPLGQLEGSFGNDPRGGLYGVGLCWAG